MLKYKYVFFQIKYTKHFYQTAVGNCYAVKLAKCSLEFNKINFIVSFYCNFSAHFRFLLFRYCCRQARKPDVGSIKMTPFYGRA